MNLSKPDELKTLTAKTPSKYRLTVILHIQEEWLQEGWQLPNDICQISRPCFHHADVETWIDTVQKATNLPPDIVQSWKEVIVAECQESPGSELQICYVYEHIQEMVHLLVSSGLEELRSWLQEKRSIYCVPS